MSSPLAPPYGATTTSAAAERVYLRQVFAWMLLGLAVTTGVAAYLAPTADVVGYFEEHTAFVWLLSIAPVGLVFGLVGALERISAQTAATLFCLYAGLTGVTF